MWTEPDFAVGFRVYEIPDSTRQYVVGGHGVPRPLRLWVWYPAAPTDRATMRIRDYLSEPGSQAARGSAAAVEEYRARFELEWNVALDEADLTEVLDRVVPTVAVGPPAPGRHPTVLLEVGLNAPAYMYTRLAEALAARGFVVASIGSFGHADGRRLAFDSAGIATQLADLEHALRPLRQLPYVDSTRVSIGGWSVGGLSALLAASRNARSVRAYLSIDGGAAYSYGIGLAGKFGFDAECFATPFLHLTGTRPGRFRVAKSREIYEGLPGSHAFWGSVIGLNHADFTSYGGLRSPLFRGRPSRERGSVTEGRRRFERIVGAFLERYVSDGGGDWKDLLLTEPIERLPEADDATCQRANSLLCPSLNILAVDYVRARQDCHGAPPNRPIVAGEQRVP
jgi:dienelactone hydrolase